MLDAVADRGDETLVVAPTFKRIDDHRETNELFWGRRWFQKWKYGYTAQNLENVGSFDVMDHLIAQISNKEIYPNLKRITLIGHSAGGQFVQRYSVGTDIRKEIHQDIDLRLVVSNPSSYLYLHPERINFIENDFNILDLSSNNCIEYNDYIYGVNKVPSSYLSNLSLEEMKNNYKNNPVIYLMGESDTSTDYLDRSCEANLQGKNRFDRALNYFQYVRHFLKGHRHHFYSIFGVAMRAKRSLNQKRQGKYFFKKG